MGRDNNIYGLDTNSMAQSIADDALGSPTGAMTTGAASKGNGTDPSEIDVLSNKGDSRAKTQSNH
jgi:hypothetical protein